MSVGQGVVIDNYNAALIFQLIQAFAFMRRYGGVVPNVDGEWPLIDDRWYLVEPDVIYVQTFILYSGDNSATTGDANESNLVLARASVNMRFSMRLSSRADFADKLWIGRIGQPDGLMNVVLRSIMFTVFYEENLEVKFVESITNTEAVRSGQIISMEVNPTLWLETTATPDPV